MTPERLAEIERRIEYSHVHFGDDVSSDCAELIAACRELMREREGLFREVERQMAENARLREALGRVLGQIPEKMVDYYLAEAIDRARKALVGDVSPDP